MNSGEPREQPERAAPDLTVAPDLQAIVSLGVLTFEGARGVARDNRLDRLLAEIEETLKSAASEQKAQTVQEVQAVRSLYRRFGIDPTKTRPSSEALLRRVCKGEALPRVNTLVDICNWCSLEFQLPYGLYDLEHVRGGVELRLGRPGEQYPGIRKDVVHVAGRPTLVDLEGPFGNPTSDSARTSVTASTANVMAVVFAPKGIDPDRLARVLDQTSVRITTLAGASETSRAVL